MRGRRSLLGLIGAIIKEIAGAALHEDACAAASIRGTLPFYDFDALPGRCARRPARLPRAAAGFRRRQRHLSMQGSRAALLDEVSAEARPDRRRQHGDDRRRRKDRRLQHRSQRLPLELRGNARPRRVIAGKTAVLVGAGGAGRAVGFALVDLGAARLRVRHRPQRAAALVADLAPAPPGRRPRRGDRGSGARARRSRRRRQRHADRHDGLSRHSGAARRDPRAGHFVADVVSRRSKPALLKARARQRRACLSTAGGMCVHQAAELFRLFTGPRRRYRTHEARLRRCRCQARRCAGVGHLSWAGNGTDPRVNLALGRAAAR